MELHARRAAGRPTRLRFPSEALALLLVAFALRAAYAWLVHGPDLVPSSDQASYDTVAWNLARGIGFRLDAAAGPYPTAFVPPAMPYLVAILYRLVGHQPFAAVLLMCALGAFAPLLVRTLGTRLFTPPVGRLAAWLTAVHPLLVFFSGYLLTEAMFTDALLVGLIASVAWVSRPSPRAAFVAGLAWGVAALTRPTALPLPLLVAMWAWLPLGLQVRSRARLAQLALLVVGTLAVVGPWTLRNARELGALIPVTTGGGRSLLDANNAVVWDDPARRGGASAVLTTEPWATRFHGLSEVELDRAAGAEARAFLRERAHEWPAMALAKLGRLWRLSAATPTTGSWGGGLAARLQALDPLRWWSLLFLPLAAVGAGLALRGPRRLHQSLPLLVVAAFSLGTTVYWGALRLRVPLEPLLALFAAHALHEGWRRLRARRAGLALVPPTA